MDTRKKPFTEFEKEFLLNLLTKYSEVIENKRTDGVSSQKKLLAWTKLTAEFNSSTRISQNADIKQIKKYWNNLKAKAREAKTRDNQRHYTTGGGPSQPDMDEENSKVLGITTTIMPSISIKDSDALSDTLNDDDDSFYWSHYKKRVPTVVTETQPVEEIVIEETTVPAPVVRATPPDIVHTQQAATPAVDCATAPIPQTVTPASYERLNNSRRRRTISDASIEDMKRRILEKDLQQREGKFQLEMLHLRNIQKQELEHNSVMNQLREEEQRLKIEVLKQQLRKN